MPQGHRFPPYPGTDILGLGHHIGQGKEHPQGRQHPTQVSEFPTMVGIHHSSGVTHPGRPVHFQWGSHGAQATF